MNVNPELIAPCGLHCEPCPLYRAQHDEDLRQALAKRLQVPPTMATCPGCRPSQGSPTPLRGELCPTYSCVEERGHDHCHECGDFPCRMLQPLAQRAENLPHNLKTFSLLVLRRDGAEKWAAQYPLICKRYFQGKMVIGKGSVLPEDEKQSQE